MQTEDKTSKKGSVSSRCDSSSSLAALEKEKKAARKSRRGGSKLVKNDMKAKLERSRQSARECRARKKLRYQYLEELVASRERAVLLLKKELELYRGWCRELQEGRIPEEAVKTIEAERRREEAEGMKNN